MSYLKAVNVKLNKETELKKKWIDIIQKVRELEQLEQYGNMLKETTETLKKI